MTNRPEQDSAIKKFFKENKSLTFMLPVLVILMIILIIIYSGTGDSKGNQDVPAASGQETASPVPVDESALAAQPQVDVLPQFLRSATEGAIEVIKDPFETPIKLKGIVYADSRSTAILEANGISYIVKEDDVLGESTWKVAFIENDSITLVSGDESMTLSLND